MEADVFLQQLAAGRRLEQARSLTARGLPRGFRLDQDLALAIRNRWFLRPVLARSPFAPPAAYAGEPDNNPAVIASWDATYGANANWAFIPGPESCVFGLEIDSHLAGSSLEWLFGEDGLDPDRTVSFRARSSRIWFALFRWPDSGLPNPEPHLPGIIVHSSGSLLIPPSHFPSGARLEYLNSAGVAEAPDRLIMAGRVRNWPAEFARR